MNSARARLQARELDVLWSRHSAEWRHPAQIASQWRDAAAIDEGLLRSTVRGAWWETLERTGATLLITREYEHLVMGLCVVDGKPCVSFLPVPHPSGLAVNRKSGVVHLASTRNPNQIYDLAPVVGVSPRLDTDMAAPKGRPLVPIRSRFLPGCLYLHDLALLDDSLLGTAVGENAVVRFDSSGDYKRIWWPRCIETNGRPLFGRNYIQLNSIAAGKDLAHSYFTASTDVLSSRRPGQKNFPVNKRGVIFSGATREPIARGLTRPHSARLFRGRVWANNSGYGELGFVNEGVFETVVRLPGWTRGLSFCAGIAFAGTSRIIPGFSRYAPGLDAQTSECAIHAVDPRSGKILGSLVWPRGNQIFGIDWIPARLSLGFPFAAGAGYKSERTKLLFYSFQTRRNQ